MQIKNSGPIRNLLPFLVLFLLTIIFFYPVIFLGKTFYAFDTLMGHLPWSSFVSGFRSNNPLITDPINNHYLWHHFIISCLQKNILPLWSGSNFCGIPFSTGYTPHGNPVVFLAYLFFSMTFAHDFVLWFHLFLSGTFMFLYLKKLKIDPLPSLIGSVAWMFNGYVIVFFEIESTIITAASLPAALYFIERWLKSKDMLDALGFTCAVAFSISSGYTHLIILQCLFIGSYLIYRCLQMVRCRTLRLHKKDVGSLVLVLVLGLLLSANFVTSHLPFLKDPQRSDLSFKQLFTQTGQLPVKYLPTLVFPDFFGSPAGNITFTPRKVNAQPYNNYSELCIYSGVATFFLALACIPFLFRGQHTYFFFAAALTTITMAMGSILYYPLATFVPGLNFSTPTRVLFIFGFSFSVLAAMGADIISRGEIKKTAIVVLWLSGSATVIGLFLFVRSEAGIQWALSPSHLNWLPDNLLLLKKHFSLISPMMLTQILLLGISLTILFTLLNVRDARQKNLFLFLCLAILATDLIQFGWRYNTVSPKDMAFPPTNAIRFLQQDKSKFRVISYGNFMHNGLAPFGIEDIGGYNSFYPKRYGEFLHLSQFGLDRPLPEKFSRWIMFSKFGSALFDLINVKYLLLPRDASVKMPSLEMVYDQEIKIYENKNAFPRVFFVNDHLLCHSRDAAYRALATLSRKDLMQKVILESPPPKDFIPENASSGGKAVETPDIEIHAYEPNRIELNVSSPERGFLVISDNFDPGWSVRIDGKAEQVLRANYIMRAIPVRAGSHKIVLEFRPKLLMGGIFTTFAGWVALLIIIGVSLVRRTRINPKVA